MTLYDNSSQDDQIEPDHDLNPTINDDDYIDPYGDGDDYGDADENNYGDYGNYDYNRGYSDGWLEAMRSVVLLRLVLRYRLMLRRGRARYWALKHWLKYRLSKSYRDAYGYIPS